MPKPWADATSTSSAAELVAMQDAALEALGSSRQLHGVLAVEPPAVPPGPEADVAMQCLVAVKNLAGVSNGPKFHLINKCIGRTLNQPEAPSCEFFLDFFGAETQSAQAGRRALKMSLTERQASDKPIFVLPPAAERDWFADPDDAQLISMPSSSLRRNLDLFRQGHPVVVAAVKAVDAAAVRVAALPDMTVTSKRVIPPTGDKRTYLSLDTYSWPANNSTDNPVGPWYKRDGYPFPGRHSIAPDAQMLVDIIDYIATLGTAFYFTRKEAHAARAARFLRVFFLDSSTGMLPSLKFASMVPGKSEVGAPTGTINFRNMPTLLDGIRLLRGSAAWTASDELAMREWLQRYKSNFLLSDHVRGELCSLCNHGLYFDMQMLAILRFLGKGREARAYVDRNVRERLHVMVRGGILPNEMVRPTSSFYVNFVAEGLVRLAAITQMEGGDLWHYRQEDKNSVLQVWDWAISFWCDRFAEWPLAEKPDVRLGIEKAVEWMGLPFTASPGTPPGEHTVQSLHYQRVLSGVIAHGSVDHDKLQAGMLLRAPFDSCLLADCAMPADVPIAETCPAARLPVDIAARPAAPETDAAPDAAAASAADADAAAADAYAAENEGAAEQEAAAVEGGTTDSQAVAANAAEEAAAEAGSADPAGATDEQLAATEVTAIPEAAADNALAAAAAGDADAAALAQGEAAADVALEALDTGVEADVVADAHLIEDSSSANKPEHEDAEELPAITEETASELPGEEQAKDAQAAEDDVPDADDEDASRQSDHALESDPFSDGHAMGQESLPLEQRAADGATGVDRDAFDNDSEDEAAAGRTAEELGSGAAPHTFAGVGLSPIVGPAASHCGPSPAAPCHCPDQMSVLLGLGQSALMWTLYTGVAVMVLTFFYRRLFSRVSQRRQGSKGSKPGQQI